MAETLVGYKEAWKKAWRPYWRKWLATKPLRSKYREVYASPDLHVLNEMEFEDSDIPSSDVQIVVFQTLAWCYSESQAPEPEDSAQIVDLVLRQWLYRPNGFNHWAEKAEGADLFKNPEVTPLEPEPRAVQLVIRKPFEVRVDRDWRTGDDHVTIYGRFGRVLL